MPRIFSSSSGATTDAGDLTTGTLSAARLPGVLANVDTQAELLSAAAAAAASHTHAISDITSLQTSLDGKLSDTGDTLTGALSFSGSISSPGGSTRSIHGNGGTTDLYANVPTGGVWGVSVNGTSQATIGAAGLQFPTAHSSPSTSYYGVWRGATGIALQGAADGRAALFANSFSHPTFSVYGPSHSTNPGQIAGIAGGVSLAAGATRTVGSTGLSGTVLVANLTDQKRAMFAIENGTPTKIEGDATIVAGAPGASEIGLELSSTTLRVNNGYATSKLITTIALLAY